MSSKKSTRRNPLISDKTIDLLQYRVEQEDLSARIYLGMSMWLNNKGYKEMAEVWRKYSEEERTHADWARDYLLALGVQPMTGQLDQVSNEFSGIPDIIKQSYDHEIDVTNQCKELATHALKEGDHMLHQLALKYLKEQVEEHDKMQQWTDELEIYGTDKIAMRLMNMNIK
jgi:ferritin